MSIQITGLSSINGPLVAIDHVPVSYTHPMCIRDRFKPHPLYSGGACLHIARLLVGQHRLHKNRN